MPPANPRRAVRLIVAAAFAFVATIAHAALPPGVTQGASVEGITEYSLANGLKVLLFPDATKPTTTVNVTYLVGSRQESYGETGMAHLLEHLLFKGTPSNPNIFQELGRRGMRMNGSTFFDRTNYFETFTASDENLDWALAMEADRMVNSFVAKKDLDTEMTVVRNEFESWREQSAARALGPAAGGGLRLAQLRQSDDRRALGHRERRHRPAAGVLPAALPARQCGADRRRAVRPRAHARPDREDVRPDSQAGADPAGVVHEGAGAGWRAHGHRPPRRRDAVRRRALPHRARRASRRDRLRGAGRGDDGRARGPAVPGARRNEEGDRRRSLEFHAGRPGQHHLLGAGADHRFARRRPRRTARHGRGRPRAADRRRRSGPRAREGAAPVRRDVQRSAEARRGDLRIDRAGRLAALLPAARPVAQARPPPTCSGWRSNT